MKIFITLIIFLGALEFIQAQNVENSECKSSSKIEDLTLVEKKEMVLAYLKDVNCEYKGIKLYGKIQFVSSFPDIKIQIVDSFPDIKVKFVDAFPDECGEWQVVDSFPDFKVQIVTSFPDIKVKVVDSFPGMN